MLAVHSIPPPAIDQNLVLGHQLLRAEQTPTGPLPMEAQALGQTSQAVWGWRRCRRLDAA